MRVTTKGRYALRAMTNLATKDSDKPVPIKQIASEEDISPEFLEQIFFRLKKTGIISSVRGPGGGFRLEKSPDDVSAKEILDAVGEGLEIAPCMGDDECERSQDCSVHGVWEEASELILSYFENLKLSRIMEMNSSPAAGKMLDGEKLTG